MSNNSGEYSSNNYMRLTFPSKPANVAFARVAIAAFAIQLPFTLEEIDEIKVATSEAVSNCVIHAYPDAVGLVEINAEIDSGLFRISIKDTGIGIADLDAAKVPSYSTNPERMGLGLVFMDSFMDSLSIETAVGQGTTAIMEKKPSNPVPNDSSQTQDL